MTERSTCLSFLRKEINSPLHFPDMEPGRSMIEMIGVLAVIGVLTIGSVAGYRYAVTKSQANNIAKEARMVYTLLHGKNNIPEEDYDTWLELADIAPDYTPTSGVTITGLRNDRGDYVRLDDIPAGVCERLLEMRGEKIQFYTEDGVTLTECDGENGMIAGFNGVSIGEKCASGAECADGAYCHEEGFCTMCKDGTVPNKTQTACITPCAEEEMACETDTDYWCCPATKACDYENKTCADSNGQCMAKLGSYTSSTQYTSNCMGTIGTTPASAGSSYVSNCEGTIASTPATNTRYTSNCSYLIGTTGALTNLGGYNQTKVEINEITQCPENQFCTGYWTKQSWATSEGTPNLSDAKTGTVYGKCQPMTTNDSTPIVTFSDSVDLVNITKGCPDNQFCTLYWTKQSWATSEGTPNLSDAKTGTVYGKCQPMTTNDSTPIVTFSDSVDLVNITKGCPDNQFCTLYWTKASWATSEGTPNLSDAKTGTVYGKCQIMSTNDSTPIVTYSDADVPLDIVMGCPKNQFCAVGWKDTKCSTLADGTTGNLYGGCVAMNKGVPACPYK